MKLETNQSVVTNAVSSGFKISENAGKLFMMLSTALYSNKEQATLYELVTNGYDEHVMAGIPETPVQITFPTNLDSNLRIRDFGRGLNEQDVYRLLCTYGESTKSTSNDFVGSWGIGFKSCASVTNSWNVISHHNGVKSQYLIFVSADGVPNITKIRDDETETSGIEIVIPVQSSRYYQWETEIKSLFRHFPVRPVVKNLSVNYQAHLDFKHGTWTHTSNNVTAVTSFREYRIDVEKVKSEIDKELHYILSVPLCFKFDIGALDLSISREGLQYTTKTISAIKSKLLLVHSHYVTEMNNIGGKDSLEYRQNLANFVSNSDIGKMYSNVTNPFVTSLLSITGKHGVVNYPDDVRKYSFDLPKDLKSCAVSSTAKTSYLKRHFNCWRTEHIVYDPEAEEMTLKIEQLGKMKLFVSDCHGAVARVKDYCQENNYYGIVCEENIFPAELQRLVVSASTLPKSVRTKVVKEKVFSNLFKWSGKITFQRADIVPDDKCCFVELKNALTGEVEGKKDTYLWEILEDNGYSIIGVKEKLQPGMKTPLELAESIVKNYDTTRLQKYYNSRSYDKAHGDPVCIIAKDFSTTKPSIWNKLHDAIQSVNKPATSDLVSCGLYFNLCQHLKVEAWKPKHTEDVFNSLESVYNHYSILSHISNYDLKYDKKAIEAVKKYIEQIS